MNFNSDYANGMADSRRYKTPERGMMDHNNMGGHAQMPDTVPSANFTNQRSASGPGKYSTSGNMGMRS